MAEPNYIKDFLRRASQLTDNPFFPSTDIPVTFPVPPTVTAGTQQWPRQYQGTIADPKIYEQPLTQAMIYQEPLRPYPELAGNVQREIEKTGSATKFGAMPTPDTAEILASKARARGIISGDIEQALRGARPSLPEGVTHETVTDAEVEEVSRRAFLAASNANKKIEGLKQEIATANRLPRVNMTKGGFIPAGQNDLYNLQNTSEEDMIMNANSIFFDENEKAGHPVTNLTLLGKALYDKENISDLQDVNRIFENIKYNQSTISAVLSPSISPVDWLDVRYWDLALLPAIEFAGAKVLAKSYSG